MNTTLAWGLLSLMGMAGCATTEAAGLRTGVVPGSPATLESERSVCRATAATRVVASHVFVPAGVDVNLEDDGIATLRFARRKGQCAVSHVELASGRFATEDAAEDCPGTQHDIVATSEGETLFARESRDDAQSSHIELGVVVYEVPSLLGFTTGRRQHVVERAFQPPEGSRGNGEKNPGLVPLTRERFLLLWVDGDENGHRLHGQPIAGWGAPAGRAVDLSPADLSVIGHASGAIGPDGRGVVAFIASSDDGFKVFATPIACE